MCLSTITRRKNLPREVTAHKVMEKREGWYRSWLMSSPPMRRGQWYPCDTEIAILTDKSKTYYLPGWHAWENQEDAWGASCAATIILVKVKLRKLICKGTDSGGDAVFVGREMKILEEIQK